MTKAELLDKLTGGLIVSCQALKDEPLYGAELMARMAVAAKEGGAVGIRANYPADVDAIKKASGLPVIGLYKADYPDSEVYITPTMKELDALMEANPDIVAMDATKRLRPDKVSLESFFAEAKKKYPDMLFMADCSTFEEAKRAQELGFDIAGMTLCGYTEETRGTELPNFEMLHRMTTELEIPVIAEGGIWEPEQLERVFREKIFAAVIGTAITRPREITRRFVKSIQHEKR